MFRLDGDLQALYAGPFAIDLPAHNGDDSWELPVPGTFVIDRSGTVRLAFAEPDYTRRLEPAAILAELDAIAAHDGQSR